MSFERTRRIRRRLKLLQKRRFRRWQEGQGNAALSYRLATVGLSLRQTTPYLGSALRGTYDGVVEGTSHIIETVAKSIKPL